MRSIAVYPGSFDPITYGHLDVIERACSIFPKVIVAIVSNPNKKTLFSLDERVEMISEILKTNKQVEISSFDGLLVDFLKEHNSDVIIRGLRAISDFEYEFQLALTNRQLRRQVETIFLMPSEKYTYLSSSLVKEVAYLDGDTTKFVHPIIGDALVKKYNRL